MSDFRRSTGGSSAWHEGQKLFIGVALLAGVALGAAGGYVGLDGGEISEQEAGQTVAETLSETTDLEYEVVSVEKESGMYRVQLNANGQLQTYYVSTDGRLLSGAMTNIEDIREAQRIRTNINECLRDQDAVLYGNLQQEPTQLQIEILGGAGAVSEYYLDVNNQENLQEATDRGIETVPALYVDGEVLENVNNLEEIGEFAGCDY